MYNKDDKYDLSDEIQKYFLYLKLKNECELI